MRIDGQGVAVVHVGEYARETEHDMIKMIYPTTSNEIQPDKAKYLYENHCAIFILENLPIGSEFGIDMVSYRIGEKFKGVKLIPPGVHFVYASSMDKTNKQTLGPRCGFFHDFKEKELLLKRWSPLEEDFDDSFQFNEDYLKRYSDNLRDLDRYLGPYNFATYQDYKNLTLMLTPEYVKMFMPECQRLRSVPLLTRQRDDEIDIGSSHVNTRIPRASLNPPKPSEDSILPDLKPDPKTVIQFTRIPKNHLDSDQKITIDQITKYNLDSTIKLEHCFDGPEARQRLLAEFQFAFVTFLLCHIYECFEQWKSILSLVCLADTGLSSLPSKFFQDFVAILSNQVDHIPEDMFEDIVESNNLIRSHIDIFQQNINNYGEQIDENITKKVQDLKQQLTGKFGWQFSLDGDDDDDNEEDQPVIVEI